MEEPSRRSFLVTAFAIALGGCTGGFYSGGYEQVVSAGERRVTKRPRSPAKDRSLVRKDPLYPGTGEDTWIPDIDPIPRKLWAPGSPLNYRLNPMGRVTRITVHHEGSETPNNHTGVTEVAADLRDIRKVHLRVMGAGDIGYHYIIDRAGRIWEGRPCAYRGAHAGGEANRGNLGVMCLGNFDIQQPTKRQLKALRGFLTLQMRKYSIRPHKVFTHQELKPTRCPGKHLQAFMKEIRPKL